MREWTGARPSSRLGVFALNSFPVSPVPRLTSRGAGATQAAGSLATVMLSMDGNRISSTRSLSSVKTR